MLVSFQLQSGDDAASLLQRISGGNEETGWAVPSPIELMLRHALKLEVEMGDEVRLAYSVIRKDRPTRRRRRAQRTGATS
jgi:hypothetical protein